MLTLYLLPLILFVLTFRSKSLYDSIKTKNKQMINIDVVLLSITSLISLFLIFNKSIFA